MPGTRPKKPVSTKQAKLFGAVAGGAAKIKGFSKKEAKEKLTGYKFKKK